MFVAWDKNFFSQLSFINHVIQISDTKFITTRIVLQTLLSMHRLAIQPFTPILAMLMKMKKHGTYNSTDHWFRLIHILQAHYFLAIINHIIIISSPTVYFISI